MSDESQKVGTDITSFYAATEFLGHPDRPREPYAEESIRTIIDLAVNYGGFFYPHPDCTSRDRAPEESFPELLTAFQRDQLITAHTKDVAVDWQHDDQILSDTYLRFVEYAACDQEKFCQWLTFFRSPDIMRHREPQVREDTVHSIVKVYWELRGCYEQLQRRLPWIRTLPLPHANEDLRYAFDTFYRALPYSDILAGNQIRYFPHSCRNAVFGTARVQSVSVFPWSWGEALVFQIKNKKQLQDVTEVTGIVKAIREKMHAAHMTFDDGRKPETQMKLESIACELGFDRKIRDELIDQITKVFVNPAKTLDKYVLLGAPVFQTLVGYFSRAIDLKSRTVPAQYAGIGVIRRLTYVPGLRPVQGEG